MSVLPARISHIYQRQNGIKLIERGKIDVQYTELSNGENKITKKKKTGLYI